MYSLINCLAINFEQQYYQKTSAESEKNCTIPEIKLIP